VDEIISNMAPPEVFGTEDLDLEALKWDDAKGSKGPYQRSTDTANPVFKALLAELAQHEGRMTKNGYFLWAFDDKTAIGRKIKTS